MLQPSTFFDLSSSLLPEPLKNCVHVWQMLSLLEESVEQLVGNQRTILGQVLPGAHLGDRAIYIGKEAVIQPGAYIQGPAYIGDGAVVRHGAFVRENVIMLPGSVLGHASEAKNSLLLPHAQAPHFNYVGDSILGQHTNLGAGTKLSNLAMTSKKDARTGKRPAMRLTIDGQEYDTGLPKLGAILGDGVQTGCNVVLNPGCLVGRNTLIYPNLSLPKGYYPSNKVIKLRQVSEQAPLR